MFKKLSIGLVLVLILLSISSAVFAQNNGSIRGTVYLDSNADGKCVGTGEPTHAGTPIKLVTADGKTEIYLASGDDGTYGLVNAGLGTWSVSAEPSANDFVVTSQSPINVFLTVEQPVVTGIDFCIAPVGTTPPTTPPGTTLPESGAAIAPQLLVAVSIGIGFIVTGTGVEIIRRRSR